MAQYRYNGQVLVKNSRREDFEYACIENRDGKIIKIQISSTFDGAGAEKRRRISENAEHIENCKRAIKAIENGKDSYFVKIGRSYSEMRKIDWYQKRSWRASKEEAEMKPIDYYNHCIEEDRKHIEWLEKNWIIVKVEKV